MVTQSQSRSLFDTDEQNEYLGADGLPLEGTVLDSDGSISGVKNCILRFQNGYLDGGQQPAVVCKGHVEYWKNGLLHRDDDLAAVSTDGFTVHEYWRNGKRIK